MSFLNHGSFGACPEPVLEAQRAWRDRLEREPVRFLDRELEGHLDAARSDVAAFLGADPEGLAFVPNTTTGVSTVLASRRFGLGDELLAYGHRKMLEFAIVTGSDTATRGLLTMTDKRWQDTIAFLRHAPIDLVQITKFTPYPGTPAYPTIREHGSGRL